VFIIDERSLEKDVTLFELNENLKVASIDSIEFIEPGLIIITTKSGNFFEDRRIGVNKKTIDPNGYREAAEFYSPKYETEEELKKSHDRRTTIFWKPNVVFENGDALFDFYTADYKTTYSVVIEGIANNGQIIRKVGRISVKGKNK
jgi:hypothetical protein